MSNESVLIKEIKMVVENGIEENGFVRIHNGKMSEMGPMSQLTNKDADNVRDPMSVRI
jgi:hypothetical protein